MIAASVRVGLAIGAGFLLWLTWRRLQRRTDLLWIVGAGLAARGLLGSVLFWISYLELPIGRSLQLGNGFWFIALDGTEYFRFADLAAAGGPLAIWHLDPTLPSVFYIKVLALVMYVVGRVPSAALLLNVLSYLGLCGAIVLLAERARASRAATVFAVGAVTLSPSWMLWSLQPLKDPLFMFLVAAYAYAGFLWLDHRRPGGRRLLTAGLVATGVALWGLLYAVSGIRWYFGVLLFAATVLGWLVAVMPTGMPGWRRLVGGLALTAALSQAIPIGAGPFLPRWVRPIFRPGADTVLTVQQAAPNAVRVMDNFRATIAATGETEIRIGRVGTAPRGSEVITRASVGVEPSSRPPESRAEKFFVGAVAMGLPLTIGSALGWVHVGGGRGLWAFAELDTLFFDATLLFVLGFIGTRLVRRRAVLHPAFWLVLSHTVVIAALLAYDSGNFGTLFRHRGMVFVGLVLLPLLVVDRPRVDPPSRETGP
ncbi:MAG TPA: hypothetical protein VMM93_12050 [Vicinamibacterales bacterium]|nr:hypothetical protein [Vicinamibacterales bacterium]